MARPIEYDEAVFSEILERLAAGEMLNQICESGDKFPCTASVRRWVINNVRGCSARYTQAREIGMHEIIDQTIQIADDGRNDWMTVKRGGEDVDVPDQEVINRSRLRVDTRKWLASKVIPKIYGDKIQQEVTGADGQPLTINWVGPTPKA